MFAQLHQVPTPDLSVETLNALSAIMLAQGQESIWNKTEQGQLACEQAFFCTVLSMHGGWGWGLSELSHRMISPEELAHRLMIIMYM